MNVPSSFALSWGDRSAPYSGIDRFTNHTGAGQTPDLSNGSGTASRMRPLILRIRATAWNCGQAPTLGFRLTTRNVRRKPGVIPHRRKFILHLTPPGRNPRTELQLGINPQSISGPGTEMPVRGGRPQGARAKAQSSPPARFNSLMTSRVDPELPYIRTANKLLEERQIHSHAIHAECRAVSSATAGLL